MKRDTWRSWPRQVYSDRWRFEGYSRRRGLSLRARVSFRRRAHVNMYASSHVFVYLVGMILGSRGGPALWVLDDVFLSRENRNFYAARLGISPERAASSIDKPSERIYIRYFWEGNIYPSDTLRLASSWNVCEWMKRENGFLKTPITIHVSLFYSYFWEKYAKIRFGLNIQITIKFK